MIKKEDIKLWLEVFAITFSWDGFYSATIKNIKNTRTVDIRRQNNLEDNKNIKDIYLTKNEAIDELISREEKRHKERIKYLNSVKE